MTLSFFLNDKIQATTTTTREAFVGKEEASGDEDPEEMSTETSTSSEQTSSET